MEIDWSKFKAIGGLPPIIWESEEMPSQQTLESRGFSSSLAGIQDILQSKKNDNFLGFNFDEEENIGGFDVNEPPHNYSRIDKKGKKIKPIKKN